VLSDKHKEYAQYIHQSGGHLLNIIGDILDLSKIEAGQFVLHDEETTITPLIDTCILMVKERAASKGLRLRTGVPLCLPVLRVDPLRLKQVILNLLSNAIKFTDNGSVTFTVFFDEAKGLVLVISDTGIGMTQEEMATALEPFGQVESALTRNHDGTGLGLPIALHLVELHGGQLILASRKGHGTTVSILIPPERLVEHADRLSGTAASVA
jgi:signal transduction histidine kinase